MRPNSLLRRCLLGLAVTGSLALPSVVASAARALELPSVLVIAKSSNRNEVHYAAVVDQACAPVGTAPLRPYWRMLERGPSATEGLLDSEQRWLGIGHQEVTGNTIQMSLRAMPARKFTVRMEQGPEGGCSSWVGTTIASVPARVASVYVKQKFFGVDYVLLTGWAEDGSVVRERVSL
jgi:hypothetical protein